MAKISVFFYFIACLFGRQYLYPRDAISPTVEFNAMNNTQAGTFAVTGPYANHSPDMYVPVFTIFEFICFVGWIKVADELLNPFGDDDYDFQINYLIDRNFQVSYMIVDESMPELEMKPDPFLDKCQAGDIPPAALPHKKDQDHGCCNNKKGIKCTFISNFTENLFTCLSVEKMSCCPCSEITICPPEKELESEEKTKNHSMTNVLVMEDLEKKEIKIELFGSKFKPEHFKINVVYGCVATLVVKAKDGDQTFERQFKLPSETNIYKMKSKFIYKTEEKQTLEITIPKDVKIVQLPISMEEDHQ